MNNQGFRAEEDIYEEELQPIAPGLACHDSTPVNSALSLPISFHTLSARASQHQPPGRSQDDAADFFKQLNYHSVSVENLCTMFGTTPDHGLDDAVVARNIQRDGENTIAKKKQPNYLMKILTYILGAFGAPLLFVAIISLIWYKPTVGPRSHTDLALSIVVIVIILSQASFSTFEHFTGRIVNSILNLIPSECFVIREGRTRRIPTANLVVGDIVVLSVGNKVPADMRLIETSDDLRFNRSVFTDGNSEEIRGVVQSQGATFLEAPNIAFMGTHVVNGRAKGVVVLTGGHTVIGRISKATNKTKEKPTLMQQDIRRFVLFVISLNLATMVSIVIVGQVVGHRRNHDFFTSFSQSINDFIGCIVAFIPEGIPFVVTLTMSLIARRMRKISILSKSFSAVGSLGCVTVICSDKTGTLTENKMSVVSAGLVDEMYTAQEFRENFATKEGESAINLLYKAAVLCNGVTVGPSSQKQETNSDATDSAIFRFVEYFRDASTVRDSNPEIYQVPFNSRNKWMLTMHNSLSAQVSGNKTPSLIFVKGAPEILIPRCSSYFSARTNDIRPFDCTARATLIATQEKWSHCGQRVVLLCMREYIPCHTVGTSEFSTEISQKGIEALTIVGILGLMETPRPESAATINDCRKAGIRFFMVTGDFGLTAVTIARQVGIITTHAEPDSLVDVAEQMQDMPSVPLPNWWDPTNRIQKSLVLEGKDLDLFTENHWNVATRYEEIVFARVTPEQKLSIVTAFQERDNVIAVTGDGVNDAPALKEADIGIAVVGGSDVAIEAADLVLLGNFDSIINGIRLGRLVFQNMQKAIVYLLPAGLWSQVLPIIMNAYFGLPLPLSPFLMIVICCFTDLLPCLSLIMEKEVSDLLMVPPCNHPKDRLFNLRICIHAFLFVGMMETVIAHAMFFFYYWQYARIPIGDLFLSFEKYSDGFHGYTAAELANFKNTAQCVYFVTLVILQLGNLLSVRNKHLSILQADSIHKQRRNMWPFFGALLALVVSIFVTEVHVFQTLFLTTSVPLEFWFIPLPLLLSILIMDEMRKLLVRTYPKGFLAGIAW